MGLNRTLIQFILEEAAERELRGAVLTLGRQHVYVTWNEFLQYARKAAVPIPPHVVPTLHREPKLAQQAYVSDDTILKALGFEEKRTLDYSDYEAVDEIFDLNLAETPAHLQSRFDVIFDTGTMEHVFHVPNVLANLHRMLKPDGRIIHVSPAGNCLDHGFYSFSPTFFADYYFVNRYRIHHLKLCRYETNAINSPAQLFDYLARGSSGFEIGSLDRNVYLNLAVVQRTPESTCGMIPQQASYRQQWADSTAPISGSDLVEVEPVGTKANRLLKLTAGWPLVNRLARGCISTWRGTVNRMRKRWQFPLPKSRSYR